MTPERHEQVAALYEQALDLTPDQRAAFLEKACAGDAKLRQEVESLLDFDEPAKDFIETPAMVVAAGLLGDEKIRVPMGSSVGFYRILSPLGAGGMGEVYLAEDTRLGRKIALKLLPAEFTQDEVRLRWFEKEARAASALNHPNIITIHDIGKVDGRNFIATEFIDGETLRRRMVRTSITVEEALDIGLQAANALAAAHEAGVIHRDIKPENIMLRTDGYVKVLDFGLAKLTQFEEPALQTMGERAPSLSSTGHLMGTARYMSPEQARGQKVDARSDLFSLGVVLYEILSGRCPFSGNSTTEVIASILTHEPSLEHLGLEAPDGLKRILGRSLCKDVQGRYQTAREMAADLMALKNELENLKTPPRETSSAEYVVRAINRHKWKTFGLVATAVLLAAIAIAYVSGRGDSIDSIAILPFVNESGDPRNDYLSDGISGNLTGRLDREFPNLRLIPFTTVLRYKDKPRDAQKVGSELKVRSVVLGSLNVRGEILSVRAALVDVRDGRPLWQGQYNDRALKDFLQVQVEITRDIADQVGGRLADGLQRPILKPDTQSAEAHRLYTEGRVQWAKLTDDGFRRSIQLFEQAIAEDPNYALAYSGLADSYALWGEASFVPPKQAFPEAAKYARKALSIDDTLAEAWVSLAMVKLFYDWDWAEAQKALSRAQDLGPNNPHFYHFYGHYLQIIGRTEEAIVYTDRGVDMDMGSVFLNAELGWAYYWGGKYEKALDQFRKTMDLDRNSVWGFWSMVQAYEQLGNYKEALRILNDIRVASENWSWVVAEIGYVHAKEGRRAEAETIIGELKRRAESEYIDPVVIAYIYIALNNKDEAFAWLEKALAVHSGLLPWLKVEPKFHPLSADPRYLRLMKQVGIPS
jgi:serine/threonine-protein kinase